MRRKRQNERERKRKAAVIRQKENTHMAERKPDEKALADFHRPAYQARKMVQVQGEQIEHKSVAEYLAERNKIGVDASGEDRRKQCKE